MNPIPANDLLIRPAHLMLALNLSTRALTHHIAKGHIPKPDAIGPSRQTLWRLATIQAWNPEIAAIIGELLKNPALAPRSVRTRSTPLLNAA